MNARSQDSYRVFGTVAEKETGRPLRDLIVRAFDRDLMLDDKLGFATTDDDGRFEIFFNPEAFRDVFESHPDIYLRVFDASGSRLILETSVRWNASPDEGFHLRIPAGALTPH